MLVPPLRAATTLATRHTCKTTDHSPNASKSATKR